ncbi:class I SAM-dependent methyltransferase [Roseiconus nitratireducens]|uniref:Class I SAM-dependent methyltransferase n=1 Tax=Roseiconus nitratireducens TaxID=2605748 RepID=A0A5M6DJ27_9BACT|nr:class I SAM-dependent methyltransferase [Roseiconus nitratireducens]KAA5546260.1 class I SAM-dependent methyltransferase [Roseiconus nitratireducens]
MPSVFQFLPLIIGQNFGAQQLERTPEPESVTDQDDNVLQYDRVMETKLAISYAIAIETIYRARTEPFGGRALDLCCGPGHMSINMAKELKLDELIGVDLSAPMVSTASSNASQQGLDNLRFQTGDATSLQGFDDGTFNLCTMMDAAHHMPTIEVVTKVLEQMERVTQPDGLIVVMDLVRLRTRVLTEKYVQMLGHDYVERGLPNFLQDFRNSMFAAWTPDELAQAVPERTHRKWTLVVPRGVPFAQFLIGSPKDRDALFVRSKCLWEKGQAPVARADRGDLKIARLTMQRASRRRIC